jgi:hypothetical protein
MEIIGNDWKRLEIFGNDWKYLETIGNNWKNSNYHKKCDSMLFCVNIRECIHIISSIVLILHSDTSYIDIKLKNWVYINVL